MIQRLLNKYEEVTYEKVVEVCGRDKARVFAKVRLADVFKIDIKDKIAKEYLGFALKSHFDFLVTDEDYQPLFVVEYDGDSHKTLVQKERDKKKNWLCDYNHFSILRINSKYFNQKYRGLDLLTYFVDVWFLDKAFQEAQENGLVPYDEVFDPGSIVYDGKSNNHWPYLLSLDAQKKIKLLFDNKTISEPIPSFIVIKDKNENRLCFSWLKLDTNKYMFTETGIQNQRFPVMLFDIISQIGIIELSQKIEQVIKNVLIPINENQFKEVIQKFTSKGEIVASCTSG